MATTEWGILPHAGGPYRSPDKVEAPVIRESKLANRVRLVTQIGTIITETTTAVRIDTVGAEIRLDVTDIPEVIEALQAAYAGLHARVRPCKGRVNPRNPQNKGACRKDEVIYARKASDSEKQCSDCLFYEK